MPWGQLRRCRFLPFPPNIAARCREEPQRSTRAIFLSILPRDRWKDAHGFRQHVGDLQPGRADHSAGSCEEDRRDSAGAPTRAAGARHSAGAFLAPPALPSALHTPTVQVQNLGQERPPGSCSGGETVSDSTPSPKGLSPAETARVCAAGQPGLPRMQGTPQAPQAASVPRAPQPPQAPGGPPLPPPPGMPAPPQAPITAEVWTSAG